MNQVIRTPRREVTSMQDEFDRLFRGMFGEQVPATAGAWSPALDVVETADGFRLVVDLPGVSAEDVEVSLEENVLTISGERTEPISGEAEDVAVRRSERRFGRFHRAVRLPDRVDPTRVEADHSNGVLSIVVPKAEEAKPRRIEVRAS